LDGEEKRREEKQGREETQEVMRIYTVTPAVIPKAVRIRTPQHACTCVRAIQASPRRDMG
jgi:hypothetical protein